MFIYNLKLNKNAVIKTFLGISLLIILFIVMYSVYIIFFKSTSTCDANQNEIIDLNETNYTNILKSANENLDSYVGSKVHITGYIYRLIDFDETQFVIARDMKLENNSQSLIVGFLCEYKDALKFSDGTWVEVVGKIKKGKFYEELAVLDVISIKETHKPENIFVNPPSPKLTSKFHYQLNRQIHSLV